MDGVGHRRSSRTGGTTSHLPGTVEQTAEAVTAAGGHGVAAICDHRDDAQVRAVVGRIERSLAPCTC